MSSGQFKGTFGHANSTVRGKKIPISLDRTFSASSSDLPYNEDTSGNFARGQILPSFYDPGSSTSNPFKDSGLDGGAESSSQFADDCLSCGDIPSDLVVQTVEFGSKRLQTHREDEDGANSEYDEVSSLPDDPRNSSGGKRSDCLDKPKRSMNPNFRNPHHLLGAAVAGTGERKKSTSESGGSASTITQHYYPEGGWGYVTLTVAVLCHLLVVGIHLNSGVFIRSLLHHFDEKVSVIQAGWLGSSSMALSLLLSPIWVSICKRKSTRLAGVFGGLVTSLGCLFTSFASQFHQLFISHGAFIGVGVGLTRDASSLMVGQYFKRKRDLVEIIVVSASGLGILVMSVSVQTAISSLGWRLGLQAITGCVFITFFLGSCYRSASLYHPQRRAILHLKNQKRKVKEKEKREEKPPFLDFSCLRSKTLQILLLSCAFTAFGINTPLFYLAVEFDNEMEKVGESITSEDLSVVLLHVGVGLMWIIGCILFGLIVLQKNKDCRVSKQYLCQMAGVICGLSVLGLSAVEGFNGLLIFSCIYGFSLGGYNYVLKVYTYERVRARHFPRAWSFIQCAQAIPLLVGVPFTGYVNNSLGSKVGYYFSAISVIIGSASLFLTDMRRRRLSRRKALNSSMKTCETLESAQSPKIRRLSFAFPPEQFSPGSKHDSNGEGGHGVLDPSLIAKELTCISEEGIADMDFQDICFDEWAEYFGGDCITSCNKVENCLVSEYDPEFAALLDRKSRRWSGVRPNLAQATSAVAGCIAGLGPSGHYDNPSPTRSGDAVPPNPVRVQMALPREIPSFKHPPRSSRLLPRRSITVIPEAESSV